MSYLNLKFKIEMILNANDFLSLRETILAFLIKIPKVSCSKTQKSKNHHSPFAMGNYLNTNIMTNKETRCVISGHQPIE